MLSISWNCSWHTVWHIYIIRGWKGWLPLKFSPLSGSFTSGTCLALYKTPEIPPKLTNHSGSKSYTFKKWCSFIHNTQILNSKYSPLIFGLRGEMADFQDWGRKKWAWDVLIHQKIRSWSKNHGDMWKMEGWRGSQLAKSGKIRSFK